MSIYDDVRTPFIPLPYSHRNLSLPKEIMIDYENGTAYVNSSDGKKYIMIGRNSTLHLVQQEIDKLKDGVSSDGDSLQKLRSIIKNIENWKISLTSDDTNNIVDTITEIIQKFEGIGTETATIKQILDTKVDVVLNKGLTTNDFTQSDKNKLIDIETGANNYIHPTTKVCSYIAPVVSINGKTGNVTINKTDLGLQNVHAEANNYIHPTTKECTAEIVTSVNSKTGAVNLTKTDLGLSNILNYGFANQSEATAFSSIKYIAPSNMNQLIDKVLTDMGLLKFVAYFNVTPSDIMVKINGSTISGNRALLVPGTHNYEVSRAGYHTATGSLTITNSDVLVNITLNEIIVPMYTLTYNVTPTGSTIKVNGETWSSNSKSLPAGTYNYEISKDGYITKTGSSTIVSSNVSVSVTLDEQVCTVLHLGNVTGIVTGSTLRSLVGISSGTLRVSGDINWRKFITKKCKTIYIAPNEVIEGISFNQLDSLDLVYGKTINIGGVNYKCRLLKIDTEGNSNDEWRPIIVQYAYLFNILLQYGSFWANDAFRQSTPSYKTAFGYKYGDNSVSMNVSSGVSPDTTSLMLWLPVLEQI